MIAVARYGYFLLLVAMLSAGCRNEKRETHTEHEKKEATRYTCPMHPEIIRDAPGSCPICGMDLVPMESGNKAVEDVELESLLLPANEFVIATIPVTAMRQGNENMELNLVGRIDYDTRQAGTISSRVKGRIERLYVRYRYQPVRKGQRVMDIYSPELVTAQQNLLFLLQNDPGNNSLISASKERLLLMGMTTAQVAELVRTRSPQYSIAVYSQFSGYVTDQANITINSATGVMQPAASATGELQVKEGMYVGSGQAVFSVYDPGKAWALLEIFPEQQSIIKKGDGVRIIPETAPHQDFRGVINYVEPLFRPGSKTLSARVYFDNSGMKLPIGSRVTAQVFSSSRAGNWLPKEAVLSLGRDQVVFRRESGGFRAHKIGTGMSVNGFIQITAGLSAEDSVASNAHFLVDNESFIKTRRP